MLEQKATALDRLQSRVADIIAEEITVQQTIDAELRQLILERTRQLNDDIGAEGSASEETVERLQDYLHN